MAFQQLVVHAVDVGNGVDTLAVGVVIVRMAVCLVVLDGAKDFIKMFFGVVSVMEQFIVKS